MRKNKVDIITLGCSKNLVDSEQLMRQFVANGYTVEHDPHKINGEIVVVNTVVSSATPKRNLSI